MNQPLLNHCSMTDEEFWRLNRDHIEATIIKRHFDCVRELRNALLMCEDSAKNMQSEWQNWARGLNLTEDESEGLAETLGTTQEALDDLREIVSCSQ